jgi:hypothetical protein
MTTTTERRKTDSSIMEAITALAHKFDLFTQAQENCHRELNDDMKALKDKVNGNGKDGLDKRVDRLEVFIGRLEKTLNVITIGVAMLIITAVINLVLK